MLRQTADLFPAQTLAALVGWAAARRQSLESRRFWQSTFRNVAAFFVVVGLFFIWRKRQLRFIGPNYTSGTPTCAGGMV